MELKVDLDAYFGCYLAPEKALDWDRSKAQLQAGTTVSGKVVARCIFGLFIDLGVGFPALLPITQFNPTPKRRPVVIEDYPPVGSLIMGRVVAFNDPNRQIGLTQLDPHPWLDKS